MAAAPTRVRRGELRDDALAAGVNSPMGCAAVTSAFSTTRSPAGVNSPMGCAAVNSAFSTTRSSRRLALAGRGRLDHDSSTHHAVRRPSSTTRSLAGVDSPVAARPGSKPEAPSTERSV
jgi:hypothetical protein